MAEVQVRLERMRTALDTKYQAHLCDTREFGCMTSSFQEVRKIRPERSDVPMLCAVSEQTACGTSSEQLRCHKRKLTVHVGTIPRHLRRAMTESTPIDSLDLLTYRRRIVRGRHV